VSLGPGEGGGGGQGLKVGGGKILGGEENNQRVLIGLSADLAGGGGTLGDNGWVV